MAETRGFPPNANSCSEGRHFSAILQEIPPECNPGQNRKEYRLDRCYENVTKKFTFMVVLLDTVV